MSVQVRARREAAAFLSTFVGAQGELLVDTTNNRVQVHDGATPGGSPAAKLSEVLTNTRTSVADAAYTALSTDRAIAITSLTAARTITLPAAGAYPTGTQLLVFDESGNCSSSNTITITRTGADTINGVTSASIAAAYGYLALESNGVGKWTVVDQTTSVAAATRTPIADASYAALTSDRVISYTVLTAARTVTLPAAGAFPVGTRLLVIDESGGASATSTITLARAGTDTINGTTNATISAAYGYIAVQSNGTSKWTITDQPGSPSGSSATGPLAIANGGTGATTANGALVSLGAVGRTAVSDAPYTAVVGDRTIAFTALTAARAVTLPAASAYPTGTPLLVVDESGACSATTTLTVVRGGSDTINGAASAVVAMAYGFIALTSNGSGKWTVVDQSTASMGQQAASNVTITGGTIDAAAIGGATKAAGSFTNLTAAGTITLPTNSLSLAMMASAPATTLRGNLTGATANVADSTLTAHMDAAFGSTRGMVLYRGASGWSALSPGSSGAVLTSGGTGADPSYQAAGAGSAAPRSSVRQTVQGGPQSAGAPSFLPTTSASLTLTAQNVSTGVNALTVSAAQGYNATGSLDYVTQLTSNPSWTLTASATNYLFVNAQTGATAVQTLPPIYQFGGTLATTNGQFTFDYQGMIGYLGNGSAAVATPLVCVGEAVSGTGSITSTIAYAYNGYYDSGFTNTIATGSVLTKASNLGVQPETTKFIIQNLTAELGFSVGDQIVNGANIANGQYGLLSLFSTRNTVGYGPIVGNSISLVAKSNGAQLVLTPANWKYKLVAQRGW